MICQFTREGGHASLADFVRVPGVYPAGRLDTDSEGLVVLTDDGRLQAAVTDPHHKLAKAYWVQVEGAVTKEALERLRAGVELRDGITRPATVRTIAVPPDLWPRDPPIRVRREIPTAWIEIELREGRNRQVRRMTAAVGLPTLRLVRHRVGPWNIAGLGPGEWCEEPLPSAAALSKFASQGFGS